MMKKVEGSDRQKTRSVEKKVDETQAADRTKDTVEANINNNMNTVDKTQPDEDPAEENCATWTQNLLKTARISKITQEYRDNKEFKPSVSTAVSEKMADKNRYRHIFCADENRVVLKDREPSNDYIHASWMEMPDQVQFISTQGPIRSTIADFWHMIFTEKCPVIVMLCQYVEDDQEKCQRYFSAGDEKEFGEYRVKVVEKTVEVWNPVKLTVLQVQKKTGGAAAKHLVHHYWYFDWHDQIAPLDPAPMVRLYKTVLKKSANKPIVVHCSAGVGRTSTFVGIHLGAVMIRESASVEMVEVLKRLRKMRLGSIQSQLQYVFLIVCIVQLFIDDKLIKKDDKFESLLKKYADVTRKVTAAIEEEEKRKRLRKKEKEVVREAPSKAPRKSERDAPSKAPKKVADAMVEAPSRAPKKADDFVAKVARESSVYEKNSVRKETSRVNLRRDQSSVHAKVNDRSKLGKLDSNRKKGGNARNSKNAARKSKKPNIFGL